ncbi:MAG: hypothetical protein IJ449_03865 [Clostridia bacterium]|nr:hypothetical protein [Clostridia bacterium]
MKKNTTAALFALLLCAGLAAVSCGDAAGDATVTNAPDNATEAVTETETTEPDPFAEFDYGGEDIRIYTSINVASGVGNSNYLIEGPEEETGDVVNDSAYTRNRTVEEILNVNLVYTQLDADYNSCGKEIQKFIMAGEDVYDIVINDLFPMANLSVEGNFYNIAEAPYIDYSQTYWYKDYMSQLSLDGGAHQYILAGDYFIDVLRSAHALYFNKTMLASLYDDGDVLYNEVNAGTWTYDKMLSYTTEAYQDLNGNGKADNEDRFGLVVMQTWGPSIPFIISADLEYTTLNSDGTLTLAMNNEKSVELLITLNDIFYDKGTGNALDIFASSTTQDADTTNLFKSGQALILGYNRLGSFDDLRDMEDEVGILPYPKFDENQENYISSSHDTTEIGVIPVTSSKFDMTCAVLEVLNRETQKIVLPAYYETGLKVKYSRDDLSSQMIDIIHDNIGGSFALAYSSYCSDIFLKSSFYEPLIAAKTDFVSNYVKRETGAQKKLDKMVESFNAIEQ